MMESWNICACNRAGEEMQTDGRGHKNHRPAARFVDDAQEYGRAVEAESPTEDSEHECGVDHPPTVEPARAIPCCDQSMPSHSVRGDTMFRYAEVASLAGDPARVVRQILYEKANAVLRVACQAAARTHAYFANLLRSSTQAAAQPKAVCDERIGVPQCIRL